MSRTNRRTFMQTLAMIGIGGQALFSSGSLRAAVAEAQGRVDGGLGWPDMAYRTLGRTGFKGSRLIFGCGAALSRKPRDELLNVAFDAGVNVFDVGTGRYYGDAERNLAGFLRSHRDRIFLISKAFAYVDGVGPHDAVAPAQARGAALAWQQAMDESLRDLGVDTIDAYYQMGANNTDLIGSDEMRMQFERARDAGKVKHWGLSTHQNADAVLARAVATGWYDLAMIAITPGGWYDWDGKSLLPGTPAMASLRPKLEAARDSGMALVGMKAARYIAGRNWLGIGDEGAFDEFYDRSLLEAKLSAFQKSYAFVLEHGVDAVNADIQNFLHLRENFTAAATSSRYIEATA
jgi:hypothetical protein